MAKVIEVVSLSDEIGKAYVLKIEASAYEYRGWTNMKSKSLRILLEVIHIFVMRICKLPRDRLDGSAQDSKR